MGLRCSDTELEFETSGRGNSFSSSAWRGLLGQALARRVPIEVTLNLSMQHPAIGRDDAKSAAMFPRNTRAKSFFGA
jgi:hypothetical protein